MMTDKAVGEGDFGAVKDVDAGVVLPSYGLHVAWIRAVGSATLPVGVLQADALKRYSPGVVDLNQLMYKWKNSVDYTSSILLAGQRPVMQHGWLLGRSGDVEPPLPDAIQKNMTVLEVKTLAPFTAAPAPKPDGSIGGVGKVQTPVLKAYATWRDVVSGGGPSVVDDGLKIVGGHACPSKAGHKVIISRVIIHTVPVLQCPPCHSTKNHGE